MIKEFLKGKYDDAIIVPVSAQQNVNIDALLEAIAELPVPGRNLNGDPIFLVARSFDINRPGTKPENLHGTVLGGILRQGKLKAGDKLEIKPGRIVKEANKYHYETIKTIIVNLFRGSKRVDELIQGGSASIETELQCNGLS